MITVRIKTESHFPVDKKKITEAVRTHLSPRFRRDVEVGVAVVGNRMMRKLNREYRKLDKTTDVLSFAYQADMGPGETFVQPPDKVLHLGEVIVSFPEAVQAAMKKQVLVDEQVVERIVHGLDHLLGIHHE